MLKYFTYDHYVENILEIDLDKLYEMGKRLILTDLDNTLVGSDVAVPTADVLAWLKKAKEIGFVVKIASNNNAARVRVFAEQLEIDAYGFVYKPLAFKVRRYMKGYKRNEVVFIGDQLLTDVAVAKRLRLYMILVRPVKLSADEDITKFNRKIERFVVKRLKKRGLPVPPHIN
ncbi:MAG: YqeG family HAD IIIA-type phosphatase [Defluviitaleaceae bacterium]|nr:YqeG family HAD IIIA-type phosphatase [Defluviitaleaceae bacterium]